MAGGKLSIQPSNLEIGNNVQQTLINVLLEGGGLVEVIEALAKLAGQPVVLTNIDGVILAGELPPAAQKEFAGFIRWLIRSKRQDSSRLQVQANQFGLYATPLIVQNDIKGIIVTEAISGNNLVAQSTLEHGAVIATLALIKHQAVHEAEQRRRRDIMEEFLTNDGWTGGQLAEQARSLGWNFEAKPVVVLLDFGQARRYSLAQQGLEPAKLRRTIDRLYTIIRHVLDEQRPHSIIAERNNGFTILPHLPVTIYEARQQAKALANILVEQIKTEGLKVGFILAGGGFYRDISKLRNSFQEAQQALDIGLRMRTRRPIWFDEVQLYLLLERANRREDVLDWLNRTLGPLEEYDRRNKTQMLQTLEIFFETNQTLQEAAHALHIHPNTLKYRLGRIEQILGQDPFKGESQLRFYLATKMAKLLR